PTFSGWFDGDMVVHPADAQTVYVATIGAQPPGPADGLYKSTNGGATWTPLTGGLPAPAQFRALAVDPQNGNTVFAGSSGRSVVPASIYRSADGGNSWSPLTSGLPSNLQVTQIVVSRQNSSIVYAGATVVSAPFNASGL